MSPCRPRIAIRPQSRPLGVGARHRRQCGGRSRSVRDTVVRPRCAAGADELVQVFAPLLDATADCAAEFGNAYSEGLRTRPLAVKTMTSGVIYGVGDVLAQRPREWRKLDLRRVKNFALIGLGVGLLWTEWYGALEGFFEVMEVGDGWRKTVASMLLDQFLWSPLFFGLYFIPMKAILSGKPISEASQEIRSELIPTLIASARVWTPANIIIYNVPLTWRVLAANTFDLIWAVYLSIFMAEDDNEAAEKLKFQEVERS